MAGHGALAADRRVDVGHHRRLLRTGASRMATHPVTLMTAASVACWAVISAFVAAPARPAVAFGVVGPLAVAAIAWGIMERTYRRAPERLSAVMIKLFAAKMLVFGAYVTAVVLLLRQGSIPFVVS